MKNEVVEGIEKSSKSVIIKNVIFIKEDVYQKHKKNMHKKDDYFNKKEIEKLA